MVAQNFKNERSNSVTASTNAAPTVVVLQTCSKALPTPVVKSYCWRQPSDRVQCLKGAMQNRWAAAGVHSFRVGGTEGGRGRLRMGLAVAIFGAIFGPLQSWKKAPEGRERNLIDSSILSYPHMNSPVIPPKPQEKERSQISELSRLSSFGLRSCERGSKCSSEEAVQCGGGALEIQQLSISIVPRFCLSGSFRRT